MSQYIDVPAADIENFLQNKKFERTVQRTEVVYIKRSQVDPNLMIKVYTSIQIGATQARANGRDSIKVCCVYDSGTSSFGVGRFPPVFRVTSVQSVLERLDLKIKEASIRARDWLVSQGKTVPKTPVPPAMDAQAAEDLRQKNRFAQQERAQEQAAFLADMAEQVPPSEPPKAPLSPRAAFEAYAASLDVPFA